MRVSVIMWNKTLTKTQYFIHGSYDKWILPWGNNRDAEKSTTTMKSQQPYENITVSPLFGACHGKMCLWWYFLTF